MIGVAVTVVPSTYEEDMKSATGSPADIVNTFSHGKVASVTAQYPNHIIIGADTIVNLNGTVYGKPTDASDATEMIMALGGNVHEVYTGFTIVNTQTGEEVTDYESARVHMRTISREEAEAYVTETQPFDKAGSYAIQGKAGIFISRIDGDFFTIVGLPVFKVAQVLQKFGVSLF